MKIKEKAIALMMTVVMAGMNILMSANFVWAEENYGTSQSGITENMSENLSGMTEEEMEESVMIADGVDITDLPEEDGDYLIYMEPEVAEIVSIENEVHEIATEVPEVIVETDLTLSQVKELEALSSQSEEVYIEENIYLDGAAVDGICTESGVTDFNQSGDMEESGTFFLNSMDALERHNWKRAMQNQQMEEETETEWNMQMVHAEGVSDESTAGPVKVAVLDSGVEFLAGIPVERSINLVKDEQELPYYMNDMTGHGTAIADIIHRVCPQAQIYSVKVMDAKNRGRLSDIVAGIYWCIDQNVDVINMSFGTNVKSDILEKAVLAAADHNIMMVSSVGNGGTGSAVEYPAAFDEVIAVGAVNTGAEKTQESATGEEVELTAPGEQIRAKSLLGFETVTSGTSMAAPHVTGAAALLMLQSQYRDVFFIRKVLQKSSNPLGDEALYGNGLLDVSYAQELLKNYEEVAMKEWYAAVDTTAGSEAEYTDDISENQPNESVDISVGEAGRTAEIFYGEAVQLMNTDQSESEDRVLDIRFDILDSVAQNQKPVEIVEDIDYVEGRWTNARHSEWAEKQGNYYDLTATEIALFKAGATYADIWEHNMKGKELKREYWHGQVESNYIANYIFVTEAALVGGNITDSKPAMVPGMKVEQYEDIKKNMSTSKLFGRSWTVIMDEIKGGYTGQKRWRQVFIYGLALHLATDAFAHSSCYKAADETIKKYYHNTEGNANVYDPEYSADHIDCTPNRWKCAYHTAGYIAYNCYAQIEGDVLDFSSYGFPCWKGFYMGNIFPYAKAVDSLYDLETLTTYLKSMNHKPTWL